MNENFETELEILKSVYDEVFHISDSLKQQKQTNIVENLVIYPIMYKVGRKYRVIVDLLMKGYYPESKVILRSILEDIYSLVYLEMYPEQTTRWVEGKIELNKVIRAIRSKNEIVIKAYPLYKELSEQVHSQGSSLNLRPIPDTIHKVILDMPVILHDEFYDMFVNIFNVMSWFFVHLDENYLSLPENSNIDSAWRKIFSQYSNLVGD
jgi:hypothetical protein